MSDITAVILAGGLGTRLRPVISDQPKVLAAVLGKPFLEYIFDTLVSNGIRRVVLCTGYMGEKIRDTFGDMYNDLNMTYSQEHKPLGTAGALRLALPLLESDTVLVLNGDSLYKTDLNAFWEWHRSLNANATILLTEVSNVRRYGSVQLDDDGVVVSFKEKSCQSGQGWINAGAYLIKRSMLESVPGDKNVSIERETFPAWVGQGLYGYQSQGRFLDIGTPESYASAEMFLAQVT